MSAFFEVWNAWRHSSVKTNGASLARRWVRGREIWEKF
jgi:hypothetical protein